MYQGHVYHKETNAPLAGLCVTDGRNIVRTDENGAFELPGWERAHVISVGVLTKAHSDWYRMIEDTIKDREGDFDFYITPAETDAGHCFLHISDTEITEGCAPWLSFVKRCVREEQPGFLLHNGDICRIRGLENHWREMNYDTMGCPVRYTLGNHDFVNYRYGEYSYETRYGPAWYSFDYGNIHYVILPRKAGEAPSGYDRSDSDIWLKKDLEMKEPGRKVIYFCHDLFSPDEDGFGMTVQDEPLNLKDHDLLAWCFGHFHIHLCNDLGGVYNICTARPDSGGIDSSPAGVRRTSVDDSGNLTSTILYYDIKKAEEGDSGVWRTRLDSRILYCAPVYGEGKIFAATFNDGFPKNTAVCALDAGTGTICWQTDTVNGVKGELAYDSGRVYAQDSFGWVYCICAESGELIWKTLVNMSGYPHHTNQNVLLHEGILYTGCSRKVIALNAENGSVIWESERIRHTESCPSRFVRYKDLLIVSAQWYGLYALDLHTGEKRWENRSVRYRSSTTGVWGNLLYAATGNSLACLEGDTGITVFNHPFTPTHNFDTSGVPLRVGDNLYLCSADSGVVRYDAVKLQQTAVYPCLPSLVSAVPYVNTGSCQAYGLPVLEGNTLIFAAADGYLHIYDAESAREIHAFHVGAPLFASPLRHGDLLCTADFNGCITAYRWPAEKE